MTSTGLVWIARSVGVSIIASLTKYCDNGRLMQADLANMDYSIGHHRGDRMWFYANTSIKAWINSFSTGLNLQSIRYILGEGLASEYYAAYRIGVEYYAENFFHQEWKTEILSRPDLSYRYPFA